MSASRRRHRHSLLGRVYVKTRRRLASRIPGGVRRIRLRIVARDFVAAHRVTESIVLRQSVRAKDDTRHNKLVQPRTVLPDANAIQWLCRMELSLRIRRDQIRREKINTT